MLNEIFAKLNSNQNYAEIMTGIESVKELLKAPRFENGAIKGKIKLFNSIRKYLSPTVVALLRMQMFGKADYNYREDEKQTAAEIFTISPDAYHFMREEWMIPLPSIDVITQWNQDSEDNIA